MFFFNINLCFAYKLKNKTISTLYFQVYDQYFNTIQSYVNLVTIADNKWHYICVDLYNAILTTQSTVYTAKSLLLYNVSNYFRKKSSLFGFKQIFIKGLGVS